MPDILTVTLNPAVDFDASVDHVVAGPKLYCTSPRIDPGGGGVNVARAICRLGGKASALVAVGGGMGQQLLDLLAAEGVPTHAVQLSGETRHSLAVTDLGTGEQFRFSLPGAPVSEADVTKLFAEIADAAPRDGYVVVSGSAPPGMGDGFLAQIQSAIAPREPLLIVDVSQNPLAQLIAEPVAPVHVLRVDQQEAAQAAGRVLTTVSDSISFASYLVTRGVARIVICGCGAKGSVLATKDTQFFCHAVPVAVRSKIGAGDSFVGAFTLALSRGDPPEQALRWGVAAASATVMTEGTALCDRSETEALFERCEVEKI